MDWYLPDPDPEGASLLRREFTGYLRRHAAEGQDLDGAALAFAELLNNAVEHSGGPVWVSVDWTAAAPVVTIADLGSGFALADVPEQDPAGLHGRGLAIATTLAERLDVRSRESGGTRVEAELPVQREFEASIDPPRKALSSLPDLDEATTAGFGREAFLRALVVQIAQEAERREGPGEAEALIAQVGVDVGTQMEKEFRAAYGTAGPLTPEQLADCYVRLKHAIDGDFYVIELTPERIVLGNRRCPFGPAVQRAPALCRMTSSVFGGIAAQNGPGATVLLEERIAVGDPECRVVVELGEPENTDERPGHRYFPPVD